MKTQEIRKVIFIPLMMIIVFGCSHNNNEKTEKIIVAKEKMILDEWGKGHTMIFSDNSSDEITYFDPSLEKRLDGKTEFIELLKPIENTFTIIKYEMLNPKVQVHGDIAILSYNLVDYSKNQYGDEQKSLWNTTEVYKRLKNDWKIIHSHWSLTKPELKQ
jgi:ketosteroid isomerase-like protein